MITPGSTVDFVDLLDEIERLTRGPLATRPVTAPRTVNREPAERMSGNRRSELATQGPWCRHAR